MDEHGGWVKAYRRRWNNPVFHNLQEAAVWAWMCDYAAHRATTIKTKYGPVHLKRGQILISGRKLAEDFGMSHKRVRDLLERLTAKGTLGAPMLSLSQTHAGAHTGTVATIVKYNEYQDISAQHRLPLEPGGHTTGHTSGHTKGTQTAQEQEREEEEGKERKEDISVNADDDLLGIPDFLARKSKAEVETQFEEWWALVPRKAGKGQARTKFKAALKKTDFETLRLRIIRYARQVADKDVEFIAHPATWLHGERWLDEDETERKTHGNQHRGNGKGRPSSHDTLLAAGAFAAASRTGPNEETAPGSDGTGNGDADGPASSVPGVP